MRAPPSKPSGVSPSLSSVSERDEIEAMLRRLEELSRATGNGELRAAYQAAVEGLDAVVYRLTMLRALGSSKPAPRQVQTAVTTSPPPTPKGTPARAVAARIGVARKRRR